MKVITNVSMQGWSLPLRTSKGVEMHYLAPKQRVQVQDGAITEHLLRYQKRKLITIREV
jgi:hypothetical protein